MNASEIAKVLGGSELFKDLSEENRRALGAFGMLKTVKKGDFLFLEGDPGEAVYLLHSGMIQLVKTAGGGREVVVRTVQAGEVFAEIVLFEKSYYPVSAFVLKKSTVLKVLKRDFHSLLDDPSFRNNFSAAIIGRLRYLTDRILYLTSYDVEERFFRFLRKQFGRKKEYTVPMSKKDLAAAIGTTPETLSRLVLRLKKQGRMTWECGVIRLKHPIRDDLS